MRSNLAATFFWKIQWLIYRYCLFIMISCCRRWELNFSLKNYGIPQDPECSNEKLTTWKRDSRICIVNKLLSGLASDVNLGLCGYEYANILFIGALKLSPYFMHNFFCFISLQFKAHSLIFLSSCVVLDPSQLYWSRLPSEASLENNGPYYQIRYPRQKPLADLITSYLFARMSLFLPIIQSNTCFQGHLVLWGPQT